MGSINMIIIKINKKCKGKEHIVILHGNEGKIVKTHIHHDHP